MACDLRRTATASHVHVPWRDAYGMANTSYTSDRSLTNVASLSRQHACHKPNGMAASRRNVETYKRGFKLKSAIDGALYHVPVLVVSIR